MPVLSDFSRLFSVLFFFRKLPHTSDNVTDEDRKRDKTIDIENVGWKKNTS